MIQALLIFLFYFHNSFADSWDFANREVDFEVVNLPATLQRRDVEEEVIPFSFFAFGRSISLSLKPNKKILAPDFKLYVQSEDDTRILENPIDNCLYLHEDETSVASFNLCRPKAISAFIFLDNTTLEINPIRSRHQLEDRDIENYDEENGYPHFVKRASFDTHLHNDELFRNYDSVLAAENDVEKYYDTKRAKQKLTVEVALFFDEAAYKIFSPYFRNDKQITEMLLAYLNGVQALYHHPSLGTSLDIVLVRLEIQKKQPADMPHYNGERSKLLDSFCRYQMKKNPRDDANPEHWDMGLYVSGLDFYAYENGKKSGVTMGLATVGGVCYDQYACVIAELGTTNVFGKPYPSAGFTSVYILAHEIGHNLGMHHDSSGNNCPKEGYIMSPSRGTNGETQWSSCSAEAMTRLSQATCLMDKPKIQKELDHSKYLNAPGQKYSAKKQCEILLRDKDAVVSPSQKLSEICYNLMCKTWHRSGYYHAGPALEGTDCGRGKWCQGGNCVKMVKPKPVKVIPGGWGAWKAEKCASGCLKKSRGSQKRRRECDNPKPLNTDEGCEGSNVDIVLCKDEAICASRNSPESYASKKCEEFSKLLPELDAKGSGLQAPHESVRPWMGCSIFCRRSDSGSYYTPRIELNDLGVSPYFPDGTWCHKEGNVNYYCLQHHCLPEDFKFSTKMLHGIGEDIPIPQNALPLHTVPKEFHKYLSLGADGKPLQTSLNIDKMKIYKEEDWETKDYVDLPPNMNTNKPHSDAAIYDLFMK